MEDGGNVMKECCRTKGEIFSSLLFQGAGALGHTGPRTRRRFNDQTCNKCCYFVKPACTAALWQESANWLWREEVRILHRRVCEQQNDRGDIELDWNHFHGQLKEEKGSWLPVSHTVSQINVNALNFTRGIRSCCFPSVPFKLNWTLAGWEVQYMPQSVMLYLKLNSFLNIHFTGYLIWFHIPNCTDWTS